MGAREEVLGLSGATNRAASNGCGSVTDPLQMRVHVELEGDVGRSVLPRALEEDPVILLEVLHYVTSRSATEERVPARARFADQVSGDVHCSGIGILIRNIGTPHLWQPRNKE